MKSNFLKFSFLTATALLLIMLQACNQPEENSEPVHTEQHDTGHHDEAGHGDTHSADLLALNNGAKWQDDAPTQKNAKIIMSIGNQFLENDKPSVEEYQTFADDVNKAINTMIQECTMKGDADMALHYWFAPLLENVSALKKPTDTQELKTIAQKTVDRINLYPQYFE